MSAAERSAPEARIDWEGIEQSSEFQELVRRKQKFVVPRVVFFLGWYVGFILLCGYAPDFMGERVYEGLTVGYCLALTQFIMVWYLAWSYVRKADRDFDPLEEQAIAHIERGDLTERADRTDAGRFERTGDTPAATPRDPEVAP